MPTGIQGINFGGSGGGGGEYNTFFVPYDANGNAWARIGKNMVAITNSPAAAGISTGQVATSYNNLIYLFGGFNGADQTGLFSYNPLSNTWATLATATTGVEACGFGAINNVLFVCGGNTGGNLNSVATVQAYDIANNSWSTKGNMPISVGQVGSCVLNGVLYIQCGTTQTAGTGTNQLNLFAYYSASDTWVTIGNYPNANGVSNPAITGYDNSIFILGGLDGGTGNSVATCYRFDLTTNTYNQIANMPLALDSASAFTLNGKIYLTGGENLGITKTTTYIYNIGNGTWSTDPVALSAAIGNAMDAAIGPEPVGLGGA